MNVLEDLFFSEKAALGEGMSSKGACRPPWDLAKSDLCALGLCETSRRETKQGYLCGVGRGRAISVEWGEAGLSLWLSLWSGERQGFVDSDSQGCGAHRCWMLCQHRSRWAVDHDCSRKSQSRAHLADRLHVDVWSPFLWPWRIT